jgi:hypothetical protein
MVFHGIGPGGVVGAVHEERSIGREIGVDLEVIGQGLLVHSSSSRAVRVSRAPRLHVDFVQGREIAVADVLLGAVINHIEAAQVI